MKQGKKANHVRYIKQATYETKGYCIEYETLFGIILTCIVIGLVIGLKINN